MGKRGYPLLLAAGETADGVTPLVDRQHPHDFFMELSASLGLARWARVAAPSCMPGCPGEPGIRPARLHAPTGGEDESRGAHHAPLAGFDAHHLRRRHGGLGAGALEARSVAVHGPRAGRGPLRHRAAAHGQHGAARELESRRQLVAAGVLGRRRESRTARAGGGRERAFRERAVRARTGRRPLMVRDARLGPQESERRRGDGRILPSKRPGCRRRTGRFSRAPNGSRRTSSARTTTTSTRSASSRSARGASSPDRAPAAGHSGRFTRVNEVDRELRAVLRRRTRTAPWFSCSSSPAPRKRGQSPFER